MENNSIQTNPASNIAESEEKINEIKLKATQKLSQEAESVSGSNVPAIGIYHFLKGKINNPDDKEAAFAKQVLLKHKALYKCFDYIREIYLAKAKGQRKNGENVVGVGADSNEIFAFAEEYYNLDDEAIERKKAEEKALQEKKRKEKEAAKQSASKDSKKTKKQKEKTKSAQPEQLSLI